MGLIKSKDTKPELVLRSELHRRGLRFRLGGASLSGRPDLVFPKYRSVVFVHGCFWHRHKNCRVASTPKSNTEFWIAKFNRNVARDIEVSKKLEALGWQVIVVWECDLSTDKRRSAISDVVESRLKCLHNEH